MTLSLRGIVTLLCDWLDCVRAAAAGNRFEWETCQTRAHVQTEGEAQIFGWQGQATHYSQNSSLQIELNHLLLDLFNIAMKKKHFAMSVFVQPNFKLIQASHFYWFNCGKGPIFGEQTDAEICL